MPKTPTYDSKCFDLAAHFLSDEPPFDTKHNRELLAIVIQRAIEDWFEIARNPTGIG